MTDSTKTLLIVAVPLALLAIACVTLSVVIWHGRKRRSRAAQDRSTTTRRELEAVARISTSLGRARSADDVARPLVREVTALLHVEFAGLVVVDAQRTRATGVYAELDGTLPDWWRELDMDLRNEPSGIASAVFDAAPVTVYDVASSSLVNPWLAKTVGAKSGVWIPLIANEVVTGVLAAASTSEKRAFDADEMAVLTALVAEAALALERHRSGEALSDALAENERRLEQASTEHARQARILLGFSKVASLLGEPVSLDESYVAAAAAAADVLGADGAALLAPADHGLAVAGGHHVPATLTGLATPPVVVEAAAARQILAAPALAEDRRFDESWRSSRIGSLLAVPVPGDAGVVLLALFAEPRSFGPDDLGLAEQLGLAARGVLDRSRLFEAERASRSLSQRLARAGARLVLELDPVAVLEAVVTEAAALVDADASALVQAVGPNLVLAAATGDGTEAVRGLSSTPVGWPAGDVVNAGRALAYETVPPGTTDPILELGYRAYLAVPVPGGDGRGGMDVLAVYTRRPRSWRDEEREALGALAASAAVALANAALYRRVALEREQSVAILSNIGDGIVAAEKITGVPASEAIGRSPSQVLQRELSPEGGKPVAIRRGTDEVWLSLSEAVMRDPGGEVAGRIFAFRDVSSELAVEAMRSEFVSAVSVDLRAPLTTIYGFAQTLLRDDVSFSADDRRRFLEFIAREAEHLTATVDSLLDVGHAGEPMSLHEELALAPRTENAG